MFVLIHLIFAVLHHRLYNIKYIVCSFFIIIFYIGEYLEISLLKPAT